MSELKVEMVDSSEIVFAMMKDAGVRSFVVPSSGIELFLSDMRDAGREEKRTCVGVPALR